MTRACLITLSVALGMFFVATLLYQAGYFLRRSSWDRRGRSTLMAATTVLASGLGLHFLIARISPFADMVVVIALVVFALLVAGLLVETRYGLRQLGAALAPMAFFSLLYPVLAPLRFADSESILLRYPLLGLHVLVSLLGLVGFALSACAAGAYLTQARGLKRGRLNRYLPALAIAASVTYKFAAIGFSLFSIGLGMGIVWMFGVPGEHLNGGDPKIWMALPTWAVFAFYLYHRGVGDQHGSRLKWLVIFGFLLALANLMGFRHDFS